MIKFKVKHLESLVGMVIQVIASVGDFKEEDSMNIAIGMDDVSELPLHLETSLNALMDGLKSKGLLS
jgi:hypothetical protein